ncbi:polysaccharide deacetylase family protein [Dyadobacter sp. CY323]|uniref:polysaccharide deacetylase family protein n=1 Tax=Dyadobacter sp. CY323 TaxID=2907302 RepID=UPI001F18212A|nr:polysaccharide deacetylase family protein [Dyadobacter sp. CY323]MCE6989591.1 polysaccharide deacetylase family protein [Dyadobacter sp. CY323]
MKLHRLLLLIILQSLAKQVFAQKQIAITIDDLPTVSSTMNTDALRSELTDQLLGHLKQYKVQATGYVIGEKLVKDGKIIPAQYGLLRKWLKAGHSLGNHTFGHLGINDISAAAYEADVLGADTLLRGFLDREGAELKYFRHPYLHRGNTAGKRDSLEIILAKHKYIQAPVTVDNDEYLFAAAFDKAMGSKNQPLADSISKTYVNYMMDYVHYYESQADSLFHRPIPHILLMHANLLNSKALSLFLSRLKEDGYQFVTLQKALEDPCYLTEDQYIGKRGISWIHRWAITKGKKVAFFKGEPAVPKFISDLTQ